jgi:integrase
MANKTTVALTMEQYKEIINTMRAGGAGFRPNDRIATCLVLEANLGLRIEDILQLRLCDIVKDGANYRLDMIEQKTKKKRTFLVPLQVYQFIYMYCDENNISKTDIIFPITERAVQKHLKKVADYLEYENIGTHSFRKFYASDVYEQNNHDIELVRDLLQHSSTATTQRYIKRSAVKLEEAIQKHIYIM